MAKEKMTNVLVLTFADAFSGKDRRLRIPNPRPDLTGAQVKKAMDLVAEKSIFWDFSSLTPKSAKVVKTTTDMVDITAE